MLTRLEQRVQRLRRSLEELVESVIGEGRLLSLSLVVVRVRVVTRGGGGCLEEIKD